MPIAHILVWDWLILHRHTNWHSLGGGIAQGSHASGSCFSISVMMTSLANMVGEADSKEASRRFRHWRTRMFDTLQTASAFGEDLVGDAEGWGHFRRWPNTAKALSEIRLDRREICYCKIQGEITFISECCASSVQMNVNMKVKSRLPCRGFVPEGLCGRNFAFS